MQAAVTFRRPRPDYLVGDADMVTSESNCDLRIYADDGGYVKFPAVLLAAVRYIKLIWCGRLWSLEYPNIHKDV